MKRSRASLLLLSGAALVAFALPAAGQREKAPESLLPPGFGDPAPKQDAPPADRPSQPGTPGAPTPAPPPPPPPPPLSSPGLSRPQVENSAAQDLAALAAQQNLPPPIEIPDESRRPTNPVGPLTPANWGLPQDAFGGAHGVLLTSLMRRLDAPVASRWTSMLLRRALLSRVPAPSHVNEVDWVAERAWLLLRMGEADAARALVQSIDVDRFTPRMYTVAVQTALATADPAALCPLVAQGREVSEERVWPLAAAMCAALEGEAARASQLIDRARGRSGGSPIDVLLAEKVIGAGTDTRRAVSIQWDEVDQLNSWRFGLASATGLEIPDRLMQRAGPQVHAWQARAPMVPIEQRVPAAFRAAALGVFSNAALVEMFSLIGDNTDPSEIEGSIADRLRRAYAGRTVGERMEALANLWGGEGAEPYSRLILTAAAAARIPPDQARGEQVDELIASMLSAGLDRQAAQWGPVVEALGGEANRAWSLLAVGTAQPAVDLGRAASVIDDFGGHRGRMLAAALAGLGRLDDAGAYGINTATDSRWDNMIASAARSGQPGTVALVAAVGMQTGDWRAVPPDHLYHILAALRQVGLEYEARMIAAEAMTRL
ncbi:MAG: hypothetical protein ACK40O_02150 [Allosphingosinicella sp.]